MPLTFEPAPFPGSDGKSRYTSPNTDKRRITLRAVDGTNTISIVVPQRPAGGGGTTATLSSIDPEPEMDPGQLEMRPFTYQYYSQAQEDNIPVHDSTAAVQAFLDQNGPKTLTWNKAASVRTLLLNSDTTILATADDLTVGAMLRSGTNKDIFRNKNLTWNPAAIIDQNIRISGGSWNAKGFDQTWTATEGLPGVLNFRGVDGLILENMQLVRAKVQSVHLQNIKNGRVSNCHVKNQEGQIYTDGFHLNGAIDGMVIEDCSVEGTHDDKIAINGSSDPYSFSLNNLLNTPNAPNVYDAMKTYSGQKNITVRRIEAIGGRWFVRILPAASLIENVFISDLFGYTHDYWLTFDNFYISAGTSPQAQPGQTYAKNINFTDIHVDCLPDESDPDLNKKGTAFVACNTDVVNFLRVTRTDYTANWCSWRVMGYSHTTITYNDGVEQDTAAGSTFTAPIVQLDTLVSHPRLTAATIEIKNLTHTRVAATASGSCLIKMDQATIGTLDLAGTTAQNLEYLLKMNDGAITTLDLTGTSLSGGIKPVYLEANSSITTIRFVGYGGTLASLVAGPGAANVGSLATA
ncbi:glycosyl hydrolase family 28 protein [Hymenobacter metallicola]|uniref:Right-handed parallel beta-helix repeat-containing protein n=1 Tax=Hymenobacter metallicola TaxID=2563114 RepID=A0A4Z0QIG7_9BACT|nr:glycosyl hydrolase family 28 protein [Hymenobacter metallicola]TGE29790.1 hypothetical protein E5K02_10125 [Hymenobacter metallicola]